MKYVLSIVVDNHANVMARVSSLFARRRFRKLTRVRRVMRAEPDQPFQFGFTTKKELRFFGVPPVVGVDRGEFFF